MDLNYEEIMGRLKLKLGFTEDQQLAKLFGFTTAAMSSRKRNNSIPYEYIIKVCKERGISIDYIIKGRSEIFDGEMIDEHDLPNINQDKMMIIPYFKNILCAAGVGCINDDNSESEISYIVLPRDGYPELSRSSHHLHAITAHGDSMEGNIMDGAILLVDFGDKGSESGKIYVVNSGGEVMVKRLFNDPSNKEKIILQSDNIYYPKFTLNKNDIEVVGRVVFVYNRAKLV
jgi:SOS-response transcriptional repressor LexA